MMEEKQFTHKFLLEHIDKVVLIHDPSVKIDIFISSHPMGTSLRVIDYNDPSKIYLKIDYDWFDKIVYFGDYIGNWYERVGILTLPCRYTFYTVLGLKLPAIVNPFTFETQTNIYNYYGNFSL